VPSIVNTAGRQRMLGQRILKSYVQLAQQVRAEQARAQVAESMREFERQLAALAGSSQALTRETLDALERCWQEFRRFALARPSHEAVLALREAGEQLLQAAERHCAAVAAQQGSAAAQAANVAGRLRMLAQRVALCYLLELRDELNLACSAFAAALRELRERSARPELRAVGELWNELTALVSEDSDHREEVVQTADRLVERIDPLVALCEQQG
jgi:nitrate/nitrite-specific signal transduction histidine kinase